MPNPFFRQRPDNTSRKGDTDRVPVDPQIEQYVGDNNPYRGIESHGVAPTNRPVSPEGYSGAVHIEYDAPVEELPVVPVTVVNLHARQRRMFHADRVAVTKQKAYQLVGADDARTRLVIRNDNDFVSVYVGSSDNVKDYVGGFTLEGNTSIELFSQSAVWVYYPDSTPDSINVSYLSEFTVEQ